MVSIKNTLPPAFVDILPRVTSSQHNSRAGDKTVLNGGLVSARDDHVATPIYQFDKHANRVSRSITNQSPYKIVHDEQNRLVCALLTEAGYSVAAKIDSNNLSRQLVNSVVPYLLSDKDGDARQALLARVLLQPLGEYGSGKNEPISLTRQRSIIADWMQHAVLGMSLYDWILLQIHRGTSKINPILFHTKLKETLFNKLNGQTNTSRLTLQAQIYYKDHVLNHLMPTCLLQPKNNSEREKLKEMRVDQPEWGYLHAGMLLLKETDTDIRSMNLDDMITVGMVLERLLLEGSVPTDYAHYFKLPAMIYGQLNTEDAEATSYLHEPQQPSVSYSAYFGYLHQYNSVHNPFILFNTLLQNWMTRPALATQQLKNKDVSESWLNNYLYQKADTEYNNEQGNPVLLPNIDKVFEEQNLDLAQHFKQVDAILLSQVLNSLSEEEQRFIEQAEIQRVKAEFNAQGAVRGVPLSPSAVQGMKSTDGLTVQVPDSIEMFKCVFNGEERIYALKEGVNIGMYKLYRVDYNKELIFDLFPNDGKARYDNDYKLRFHSSLLLKQTTDDPQALVDNLSMLHCNKFLEALQQEGYQKTTRQKIDEFLLSLVPFYTSVTEAQKGNIGEAVTAGVIDTVNFLPFIGQAAYIGGRFSLALGKATTQALRIGIKQATISQAFKVGTKQFVNIGIPYIEKSFTPKVYAGLGIELLRSVDPGFELLTVKGIKGVNALKNRIMVLKRNIHGLSSLAYGLVKQKKMLETSLSEPLKIKTGRLYGSEKRYQVVKIGQEANHDIWVQINLETGELFGRKYIRDTVGNLRLAPVSINGNRYVIKKEGISEERFFELKIKEAGEGTPVEVGNQRLQSSAMSTRLKELKQNIFSRKSTTVIDISGVNFSGIDFTYHFGGHVIDLSSANLKETDFSQASLPDVNMSKANLTEANLSEATLTYTNLTQANLTQANLKEAYMMNAILKDAVLIRANLCNAKMQNAVLTNANLMYADLSGAVLNGADFMEANLANSNLVGVLMTFGNLHNANLTNANLNEASLTETKLTGADLSGASLINANLLSTNFSNANLSNVRFIDSDLTEADLSRAVLIQSDFTDANLIGANLNHALMVHANLTQANLTGAELQSVTLDNAILTGINLSDASLVEVQLVNADLRDANLNRVNLQGANLNNAVLTNVHINNTNFSGVSFSGDETFTLALPEIWDDDNLDLMLNHFSNQGSLLTSIDSIDDKYSELKVNLALQIISSLEKSATELTDIALPLLDIFGKNPFIKNKAIYQFTDKLINTTLSSNPLNVFNTLETHPRLIPLFLNYFDNEPERMISPQLNSVFIETILAARITRSYIREEFFNMQQRASELYEKYLQLPDIQKQLQYKQIADNFGNYHGQADWPDGYAQNYLLLSPVMPGRVLLASENALSRMLHPDLDTQWNSVFHFKDGKNLSLAESSLSQCYTEVFPLFATHFSYSTNQTILKHLIESLNLGDRFQPLFLEALKTGSYGIKLVDETDQQALSEVFSRVLNFSNNSLKEQNYRKIINLYGLETSTARQKAEHLLSLSAVFTRYASSAIFGNEQDSPLVIRYYAYALMKKARDVDPTLIDEMMFNDWQDRLLGKEGSFCCTAILSDIMLNYAKEHFNDVLQKIQPILWR